MYNKSKSSIRVRVLFISIIIIVSKVAEIYKCSGRTSGFSVSGLAGRDFCGVWKAWGKKQKIKKTEH